MAGTACRRAAALVALYLLLLLPASAARAGELVILGPTSMREALDEANAAYSAATGTAFRITYDASGTQARQIEEGARPDLFIAGGLEWVDYLEQRKLLRNDTRANLVRNRMALIAGAGDAVSLDIVPGFALDEALGSGRLVIADPALSTAGTYASTALQRLGAWTAVQSKLVLAPNVRTALAMVGRGEARLGIVFETDAQADPGVRKIGIFPSASHPPVVYPIVVLAGSTNPEAPHYATWLASHQAMPFFVNRGFTFVGSSAGR